MNERLAEMFAQVADVVLSGRRNKREEADEPGDD